ncbi:MAG: DUF401 family protein [Nitrososphaerota archaeon]|nr:DUF401 family protein [Candidatus Bathyarchaeota archaeon]MDW8194535.1 DUF401 family protein [Nitrososphaerota archaeon]
MGIVNPLAAATSAFILLGFMLYKRVKLGIALNVTAILLALLAVDWPRILEVVYASIDPSTVGGQLTLSIVFATFGIMLLSQLYKETGVLDELSASLGSIIKNPKIILSAVPAMVGLLPVPGGAVMSAPIVDAEGEKLKLNGVKKAYVNLWFRHVMLPIYPLAPVFIVTTALTGIKTSTLILIQLPIVAVMIAVGYLTSFRGLEDNMDSADANVTDWKIKPFIRSFSPILVTIVGAIGISLVNYEFSRRGLDVLAATIIGLMVLAVISRTSPKIFLKALKSRSIYDVAFATYGAFLIRNVMNASGFPDVLRELLSNGKSNIIGLMAALPTIFSFLTGSPSGGVVIGASVLGGILNFMPKDVMLIYVGAYLGYLIAPTHLCFTFTAEYFKASLGRVYAYLIPSFMTSFATAILLYFLLM